MKQKKRTLRVITLTLLCASILSGISLQAAVSIVKMTGTTIPSSIYYSPGDTIEIIDDPLEAADWSILKGLSVAYHLELPDHNQPIPVSALQGNTTIHSVYAPNATSIGNNAFYGCTALTSVTFSEATSIGDQAFYSCMALPDVIFPEAISIGNHAFWKCTVLSDIAFPKATSIGNYAFGDCTALPDITFPEVISIGDGAFYNCSTLLTATFSKAPSTGNFPFWDCTALTTATFLEATSIGEFTFNNCPALATVVFPKVTSIRDWAFQDCVALTTVTFPQVDSIGVGSFAGCKALPAATFPKVTSIGNNAFINCIALSSVAFPEATSIGQFAFQRCSVLTTVTFPKVDSIGNGVFFDCPVLTTAIFPEATSVGVWAFEDCVALTTIDFPKIDSIKTGVFAGCRALPAVTFPNVTSVGERAFINCIALTTATFPKVDSIGKYAFRDCQLLTTLTFPQATMIVDSAFYGCTALTSVTFPQVAVIGDAAFYNCNALKALALGTTPPALGALSPFPGLSSLLLVVPDSVSYTPAVLANYPVGSEAFNKKVTSRLDTLVSGSTLTLTPDRVPALPGGFFQWERNGAAIPGAGNAALQATEPGLYTLKYFREGLFVELLSTRVTGTSYDLIGIDRRYEGCDYVLQMNFLPATVDRTVEVWSQGTGADFLFDMDSKAYLKNKPTYPLLAGDSILTLRYSVDGETAAGCQATLSYRITSGGVTETTDVYTLYAQPRIELVRYHLAAPLFQGALEFSIEKGSNHLLLSLNDGLTWQFARDTVTGDVLPLSQSQIANFELGSSIFFREPNGCGYQTLKVGEGDPLPGIMRTVTIPVVSGMTCSAAAGIHRVASGSNFSFILTPTGENVGKIPHVSTSRVSLPDSEGVSVTANGDRSYTVTIYRIQEPITVTMDFSTANDAIDGASSSVWTGNGRLYVRFSAPGTARIHSIGGVLVGEVYLPIAGETVSVPLSRGFYVVTMNGKVYKVVH